jgi:mannose/fructose-specific phosphotransferase system component IIA
VVAGGLILVDLFSAQPCNMQVTAMTRKENIRCFFMFRMKKSIG